MIVIFPKPVWEEVGREGAVISPGNEIALTEVRTESWQGTYLHISRPFAADSACVSFRECSPRHCSYSFGRGGRRHLFIKVHASNGSSQVATP